jgi:sRNA-binding regulator protein Hfq
MYEPGNVHRSAPPPPPQRTRKRVPPEQTHAENYYYKKQMEGRTPMVVVLADGEMINGTIEWYDKNCIKIHRNGEPNLLVFKHGIKYLYKQERKKEPIRIEAVEEREELMDLAADEEEELEDEEEDDEEPNDEE